MKRSLPLVLILVAVLFTTACSGTGSPGGSNPPPSPQASNPCGDGICQGVETSQNCPADCNPAATEVQGSAQTGEAPLYMTTMTHMEKSFNDDEIQAIFEEHILQLTTGMDLADEYGAKLTVESEKPFALANTRWGNNFMAQIVARGHGTGTHCDFGFRSPEMPVDQYADLFAENKAAVDALVGAENNLGCSGGGGANDWAQAASLAGFKYLDGIVGMHYLAMPIENRPGPEWTDTFIIDRGYHYNAPVDLYDRIYPFLVANARDFIPDENGTILVSSGEMGVLAGMQEGVGEIDGSSCRPECALTNGDVDSLVATIRDIDRNRDRSRIAKVTVYLPANVFVAENDTVLRYFFSQLKTLADQGMITWATQKEVYNAFVEWNK